MNGITIPLSRTPAKDIRERFEGSFIPEPNCGCWIWTGVLSPKGYGLIVWNKRHATRASHLSLALHGKPVPTGMLACHTCDFPPCVNPDHLYAGTVRDNVRDAICRGRHHLVTTPFAVPQTVVEEIRASREGGASIRAIARRHGVAHSTVSRICSGKSHARG